MTDTRLADISEFQEEFDAGAYLHAGNTCLIVRAHNGHRPDNKWPTRRDYVRRFKFDAVGFYQYLVANRLAVDQARDFVACVGPLRPNEFVICDSEEGSGSQVSRVQEWFAVVDASYGKPSTLYASESWFQNQLGGAGRWTTRPRWVAAYRNKEPQIPHELWQYTDKATFAGLRGGVDGDLFHGSAKEFARTFAGAHAAPPSLPADTRSVDVVTMPDGRQEIFVELTSGEIVHRWNDKDGGWIDNWHSLGKPGQ